MPLETSLRFPSSNSAIEIEPSTMTNLTVCFGVDCVVDVDGDGDVDAAFGEPPSNEFARDLTFPFSLKLFVLTLALTARFFLPTFGGVKG